MKLSYHDGEKYRIAYPNGYWYAESDDGKHVADGPDPLTAVSRLVLEFEKGDVS